MSRSGLTASILWFLSDDWFWTETPQTTSWKWSRLRSPRLTSCPGLRLPRTRCCRYTCTCTCMCMHRGRDVSILQWNLSNLDTFGTVLISEVSSCNVYKLYIGCLGLSNVSCLLRRPHFRVSWIRGSTVESVMCLCVLLAVQAFQFDKRL